MEDAPHIQLVGLDKGLPIVQFLSLQNLSAYILQDRRKGGRTQETAATVARVSRW